MKEGRSVGSSDPKKLKICFAALRAAGRSVGRTESGSEKSEKEGRSAGMFSVLKTSHRQFSDYVLGAQPPGFARHGFGEASTPSQQYAPRRFNHFLDGYG